MQEISQQLISLFGILFCTSFTKVFTVLTLFRFGLGIKGQGYGLIIFGVSLSIALFGLEANRLPDQKDFPAKLEELLKPPANGIYERYKPYLQEKTDQNILSRLDNFRKDNTAEKEGVAKPELEASTQEKEQKSFSQLVTAFQLTQLKNGFMLGLIVLMPFILIDLLVANVITAIGIKELSAETISLIIKLSLFLTVGGWELLAGKLLSNL